MDPIWQFWVSVPQLLHNGSILLSEAFPGPLGLLQTEIPKCMRVYIPLLILQPMTLRVELWKLSSLAPRIDKSEVNLHSRTYCSIQLLWVFLRNSTPWLGRLPSLVLLPLTFIFSPGSTSLISHLHMNLHLRVCFWKTWWKTVSLVQP